MNHLCVKIELELIKDEDIHPGKFTFYMSN